MDTGPRERPPYGRRRATVALALAIPTALIVLLLTGGGDDDGGDVSDASVAASTSAAAPTSTAATLAPTTVAATTSTTSTTVTVPATTTTTTVTATAAPTSASTNASAIDEVGGTEWLVNRDRPLPEGYVPPELVVPDVPLKPDGSFTELTPATAAAFEEMVAAAADGGFALQLNSAYRSYADQEQLYARYAQDFGSELAAQLVAAPGTSEHQTGMAADVGLVGLADDETFGSTEASTWVAENSYRFGLIVRYPPEKAHITGYANEPWHLRYVGPELAGELFAAGVTMEEHFGLAPT